jgi:hypothetical protein
LRIIGVDLHGLHGYLGYLFLLTAAGVTHVLTDLGNQRKIPDDSLQFSGQSFENLNIEKSLTYRIPPEGKVQIPAHSEWR